MLPTSTPETQAQPAPQTMIIGGVDTHKKTHHAAAIDHNGGVLGDHEFPATSAGYQALLDWLASFGVIDRVGVELTSAYGAGLTRHLEAAGITVLEVNTTDRATRARQGKDDRTDAISAARKVLSGMATARPKDTTGTVESIRVLSQVRDSAVKDRTVAWNQLRSIVITAPAELRERIEPLTDARLLKAILAEPAPQFTAGMDPGAGAVRALQILATRIAAQDTQIRDLDKDLKLLVTALVPTLIAQPQIGVHTAAQLLMTAADNISRVTTEAKFARLTGTAPVPASSGKTTRMRLHRGGDRQANRALHMIVVGRMKNHQPTIDYVAKKKAEGKTTREAMRCLKRFIAREVFNILKHDLANRTTPA